MSKCLVCGNSLAHKGSICCHNLPVCPDCTVQLVKDKIAELEELAKHPCATVRPWIVDGVCVIDKAPHVHVNSVCDLGIACDTCRFNKCEHTWEPTDSQGHECECTKCGALRRTE